MTSTALVVPWLVEPATADDVDAIATILESRPGALSEAWRPPTGAAFVVARDEHGVAAFLAGRIDRAIGAIYADQLEGIQHDGKPTVRGIRAMRALAVELHALADREGLTVYTVVNQANVRHLAALQKARYEQVPVTVLARAPQRGT